jgi:hypothetical protein
MNNAQGPDSLRCCTRIADEHLRVSAFMGEHQRSGGNTFQYGEGTLHADARRAK